MSRGQLPRTREFFPRMKVRGGRRRAARRGVVSVDLSGVFSAIGRFAEALRGAASAVASAAAALGSVAHLLLPGLSRLAVEAGEARAREYVLSDRFQLDGLARRYEGRPLAHSEAVGRFFESRAHRELDALVEGLRAQSLRDVTPAATCGEG